MIFRKDIKKVNSKVLPSDELLSDVKNKMKIERLKQERKTNSKLIFRYITVSACFILIILAMIKTQFSFNIKNKSENFSSSHNTNNKDESDSILIISNSDESADYSGTIDLSNPEELLKLSPYVVIIKVTSLEKTTKSIEHIDSMTNGQADILAIIKGDIENDSISFKRSGGILTYNEWINGEPHKEGIMSSKRFADFLVDNRRPKDIGVETDKFYLAYMSFEDSYKDSDNNGFYIIGYQYGLREVQGVSEEITSANIRNLLVKNNDTGKWEKITDVVLLTK